MSTAVTKHRKSRLDTSSLHIRGGEFIADEVEHLMDTDARVKAACAEIIDHTADRKATLHLRRRCRTRQSMFSGLSRKNITSNVVLFRAIVPTAGERKMIDDFKSGKLRYLCNVNVLTTGFDAPNIDCIAMLRPTMSPGLYYQMVGRGFRLHENKTDCLVLDFGSNILRHGPVDCLRVTDAQPKGNGEAPAKECPGCSEVIHAAYARCPVCGYEFPAAGETKA